MVRYTNILATRFGITLPEAPEESARPFRGHTVHIDRHKPVGAFRGTVVLIHGAGGHGRLLAPFALPCVAEGFVVIAPDLPGYGLTRVRAGAIPSYAEWIELLIELVQEAATHGPVVLFGLSVGGLTACRVAERACAVNGVIATTLVELADPDTFDQLASTRALGRLARFGFRWLGGLLDRLALPLWLLTPLETLTTDPALRKALLSDPLLGRRRVPLGFFRSLHEYVPSSRGPQLPCPLLVVHPGADAWTPTAMTRAVFDRLGGDKKMVELENGAHAPLESPAFAALGNEVRSFLRAVATPQGKESVI